MTASKFQFQRAVKKALKARIALEGVSGGGKTYTALALAAALGKTTAVIDTEHKSASLYADIFDFDTLNLDRFSPDNLIEALAAAAEHDTVIVDSFSHWWMGTDGMLEQVDRAGKRSGGGNSFAGWKEMKPHERRMIEAILGFPGHVIVTLRTKTEWVIEENDRGRKVPRKIGLKAEQREGLEYEFTLVGQLDHENNLVVTKSRCPLLSGAVVHKPGEEFAQTLLGWLDSGEQSGPGALELRDRALEVLTVTEYYDLYNQADKLGLLGAAVIDDVGDSVTLGDLIKAKGGEARKRETEQTEAEAAA